MKPLSHTCPTLLIATAALLVLPVSAFAGYGSARIETTVEAFDFADRDGNNNISPEERDFLRAAYKSRPELRIIDRNHNSRLDREEIDELEKVGKKRRDRAKERDKERKKRKKNR
jgi:hypothetical protein